jgi:hypothetical protein
MGFYIPEDAILHSDRRENLKSHMLRGYFCDLLPDKQMKPDCKSLTVDAANLAVNPPK